MVIYEEYNETLIKAFSDEHFYIERDGIMYQEAIDLKELGRTYTETDVLIEDDEAQVEDYEKALEEVGVL